MSKVTKTLRCSFFLVLSCLLSLSIGVFKSIEAKERSLKHIKLIMNWYPGADIYSPYLVAIDKGYYKEEGLELELVPGAGSAISTKLVANKECDFGIADATTTLIARTKGASLIVLAVVNQDSPVGIFSLKDSGITKPKDLIGKSVATEFNSRKHAQLLGLLKKNNIDAAQISFIPVSGGGELQAMLNGQASACLGELSQVEAKLKKLGKDFSFILFRDNGLHIYDRSIITHDDTLKENPKIAIGFIKASLRGLAYTLNHPEEAASIYIKYYPESADMEREVMMIRGMSRFIENSVTKKYGLGYQTQEGWEDTQNFALEGGVIDRRIDVNKIYTNEFR